MAFPTDNCTPRIINVEDSTGCTLTRASIRAFTKQDFEDQGLKEVGMDKIIAQTKEARMTGVPERSLTDLLLSRMVGLKTQTLPGNASIIAPFSLIPREHRLNANNFRITAGAATPGAGSNGLPASGWDVTVQLTTSPWATEIPSVHKFFLPGTNVIIQTQNASTFVAYSLQYKVVRALDATSGGVAKAKVTLEPNYSGAGWAALSAGDKLTYQPTTGNLIMLANSISDYESWGEQEGAWNPWTLIEYWEQTIRETHYYNDEYLAALNAPLTSDYFKKFRSMDLVKQRKMQEMQAEKRFWNTVFFGQRINENQTSAGYLNLPQVKDPANGDCVLEFKANTLGIRTQLADCGRITDFQGAVLNLDTIFSMLYTLMRTRSASSGNIDRIDVMGDRATLAIVREVMIKYYKAKYGLETQRFYQPNQKLMFKETVMWNYELFDIPDQHVQLAFFVDPYFDDNIAAFDNKNRGRALWFVDWSDIMIGIKRTASRQSQTNIADELYMKTIKQNVTHYMNRSKTIEVRVGDTARSAIFENFGSGCPTVTVASCALEAA